MKMGSAGPSRMQGMPKNNGMSMKGGRMKGMGDKPDIADVPFESALFNGLGRFPGTRAPLTKLDVKPGETLRLRLINASSTYQFRVQIDGHAMTVIAADGAPVVPITVDNLLFSPGERYDVLITADGSQSSWIRAATLAGDEALAILHYADAPQTEPAAGPVAWGKRSLALESLRSPAPPTLDPHPREVLLRLGGTMQPYSWNINDEILSARPADCRGQGRVAAVRARQSHRHGPSLPPARPLFLRARQTGPLEPGRSASQRHGQRAGPQPRGAPVESEQPRPLVFPLPHRMARRHRHGPGRRNRRDMKLPIAGCHTRGDKLLACPPNRAVLWS